MQQSTKREKKAFVPNHLSKNGYERLKKVSIRFHMLPRYDYTIITRTFNYVLLLLVFLLLTLTAELTKNTYFRNSVDDYIDQHTICFA